MKDFRNLVVWRKSHLLTLAAYEATAGFPKPELYGLTSQIRRSAASIPANIAEGCGKRSNADFGRFLGIASSSASELEYHFLLAHDLHFFDDAVYQTLTNSVIEVKRMLSALMRSVESGRVVAEC